MAKTKASEIRVLDVYFDYRWPYVYNAAVWLQRVKEDLGSKLAINWRYFSLEQINSQQGPEWKIWEQDEKSSRGLGAFWAAEAARRQGEEAFNRFHISLLKAKHEQFRDIDDMDVLVKVAESTNLEMTRFQKDLADRQLLTKLAEDHTFAVESLGVFGTPTLVFASKEAIFLKMSEPPSPKDCLDVFTELYHLVTGRQYIQEIKKPQ